MTKTKTTETVEFPTFDASKTADRVRDFAEKGIEQSKEAYAKLKTGTEEAQKALETTYEAVRTTSSDLSLKTIAAMRTNAEAGFAHLEALIGARSLSEVVELQSSFLRQRFEEGVAQAKDFQAVTAKAVEDVSRPIKAAVEKSFKGAKAA